MAPAQSYTISLFIRTASVCISILLLLSGVCFARSVTQRIGDTYFYSDGSTSQKIGDTVIRDEGVSGRNQEKTTPPDTGRTTQKIGDTYYRSDGAVTQKIGDTYYRSGGTGGGKGNAASHND